MEINTAIGNLNNKWIKKSNELIAIQNKIKNCKLGYNIINKEVDDLKKKYDDLKLADNNQDVKEVDIDKKIKSFIEKYDGLVEQKINKNNEVIKNYMDNINNSLSNNMSNLYDIINDFIKNSDKIILISKILRKMMMIMMMKMTIC